MCRIKRIKGAIVERLIKLLLNIKSINSLNRAEYKINDKTDILAYYKDYKGVLEIIVFDKECIKDIIVCRADDHDQVCKVIDILKSYNEREGK